jgi:3'(2'), 5'-bisphosphate nucleotidase
LTAAPEDHELAKSVAARAGDALLELRDGWDQKRTESTLRDEADRLANEVIFDLLKSRAADGDGILSEELPDSPERLQKERVWVVDPLDGTREFADPSREDWAVHVGLSIAGVASAGAVALPAMGIVLDTGDPPTMAQARNESPRVAVSRSRRPAVASWVCEQLGGELIAMGSAGVKAMAVVRGEVDAYVHAGGQYEWDSCAPVAVAKAAGLHTSRLSGDGLRYNQIDPYLPDLVICRPELAEAILSAAASYPGDNT